MPLRLDCKLEDNDAAYFDSLNDLDLWSSRSPEKFSGVLEYRSRRPVYSTTVGKPGKLLVCHDYKGGYNESPFSLSYTFNYWSSVDTFVYFSHHRVTIPPPGWITAAHRHGVKILGTLIFEHSAEEDCLRLLVGKLPKSITGPAVSTSSESIPLSAHYARLLARLACQRGFDGYLLNFECPLQAGIEQTKALAAWIMLLQCELRRTVGSHAQTIWYDSIIFTGQLRWQDRLNSYNLPFFLSSTTFFTNYTWPPHYPILNAQYFLTINPSHTDSDPRDSSPTSKSLQDIFVGVDVWGRGCYGGGGFGSYKAISIIDPQSSGLSVALFGHAWTWESEQDSPGWTWEDWWNYERKLWVGSKTEIIDVPPQEGEKIPHGPFVPLSSFFPRHEPPNPADLAFHTTFSPGIGRSWFVNGRKLATSNEGWTDIQKQCSMGDMVWPSPSLAWEEGSLPEDLPNASTDICMDKAWNGGSCLRLGVSTTGFNDEEGHFKCLWLPIQSLSVTHELRYEAHAVYKVESNEQIDLDLGLSVKMLSDLPGYDIHISNASSQVDLPDSWARLTINFTSHSTKPVSGSFDIAVAIGLIVGIASENPKEPFQFSILLGQLNVFSTIPPETTPHKSLIFWADFEPSPNHSHGQISGILTWDTAVVFASQTNVGSVSPEDPNPVWTLAKSQFWVPSYLYFNIYVQVHPSEGHSLDPENAVWIATTGLDGRDCRLFVDIPIYPTPDSVDGAQHARLYIQGVNDHGEVLPWNQCIFVDIEL